MDTVACRSLQSAAPQTRVNSGSCTTPVESNINSPPTLSLSDLRPGDTATIVGVGPATGEVSPLELRLLELGFIAGERIEVVAETRPGRDPFVVRVGTSQFALRRREAHNVWVEDVRTS